jgi:hypothetical protein
MIGNFIRPAEVDEMRDGSLSGLEIDFSSDTEVADLGILHRGPLGLIQTMKHQVTGQLMAVKLFSPRFEMTSPDMARRFFRELSGLGRLRHPCLMEMVGFQLPNNGSGAAIAYEFMRNVSLLDVLNRVKKQRCAAVLDTDWEGNDCHGPCFRDAIHPLATRNSWQLKTIHFIYH